MAVKRKAEFEDKNKNKKHKPHKLGLKCNICGAVYPTGKSLKRKAVMKNEKRKRRRK